VRTVSSEEALALYEAHPQWIDRAALGCARGGGCARCA